MPTTFTDPQTATILAALRLYQNAIACGDIPGGIADIATNGHAFSALDGDDIDALCEAINTAEDDAPLSGQNQFTTLKAAQRQLQRMLDDDELRFCSETGAALEQIIANIDHALLHPLQAVPPANPAEITIYAVHDSTDPDPEASLCGYSFSAKPGNTEPHHRHEPIDPLNPGASLHLYCFTTPEQAMAFVGGLQLFRADICGQTMHSFAPDLTAVLVEFYDSAANHLIINTDHLISTSSAIHDEKMP